MINLASSNIKVWFEWQCDLEKKYQFLRFYGLIKIDIIRNSIDIFCIFYI